MRWHLPSRSLAVGASPQPDRLGHLLSLLVARIRLETPGRQTALQICARDFDELAGTTA
jgi:hypothetical protein